MAIRLKELAMMAWSAALLSFIIGNSLAFQQGVSKISKAQYATTLKTRASLAETIPDLVVLGSALYKAGPVEINLDADLLLSVAKDLQIRAASQATESAQALSEALGAGAGAALAEKGAAGLEKFNELSSSTAAVLNQLSGTISSQSSELSKGVSTLDSSLKTVGPTIGKSIDTLSRELGSSTAGVTKSISELDSSLKTVGPSIGSKYNSVKGELDSLVRDSDITKSYAETTTNIGSSLKTVGPAIGSGFNALGNSLGSVTSGLGSSLAEGVKSLSQVSSSNVEAITTSPAVQGTAEAISQLQSSEELASISKDAAKLASEWQRWAKEVAGYKYTLPDGRGAGQVVGEAVGETVGKVLPKGEDLAAAGAGVAGAAAKGLGALGGAGGALLDRALAAAEELRRAAAAADKLAEAARGTADLAALTDQVGELSSKNTGPLQEQAAKIAAKIQSYQGEAAAGLRRVGPAAAERYGAAQEALGARGQALGEAARQRLAGAEGAGAQLGKALRDYQAATAGGLKQVGPALAEKYGAVSSEATGALDAQGQAFQRAFQDNVRATVEAGVEATKGLREGAAELQGTVRTYQETAAASLKQVGPALVDQASKAQGAVQGAVESGVKGAGEELQRSAAGAGEALKQVVVAPPQGVDLGAVLEEKLGAK